jgi:superfamily II DNA or RNA helicase
MSDESLKLLPGKKVVHQELGEGVVINIESTGFVQVFFSGVGERQVPQQSLKDAASWTERVVNNLRSATHESIERLLLAIEAAELPLMDSAATLTSAKVDLLPHQVVLVHRLASTRARRFLIADEVGLGKTIETALILRELASRGELNRALMVVPASLVENWRHELNDVFNLDFEVFGHDGDVTDRKSNAFAKHDRMIISVDTLKRPQRVKRLVDAPSWDLVVFDEAHHLSVYKMGNKVKKTENYKLGETIRKHCRDLVLLSATPHQGDHFRFWMLVRLLEPTLFEDEHDMVENRYRLNAVIIRRTKADACAADGSPLFVRRVVHTEAFTLSSGERVFYDALLEYLRDGYNLADKQGGKGRALGFVMTIFQKIAASSFAAVRSTLKRRQLMLTVHEALERDELLDVDGRDRLLVEAREIIRGIYELGNDAIGNAQVDQLLADARYKLLKKRKEKETYEGYDDSESAAASVEDAASSTVSVALPEERRRISSLLSLFPEDIETKSQVLLSALHQLWQINPKEKIVIFTTYLGSVDSIRNAIEENFPNKGVEVLKGGDHGAKTAAQRRFKRIDGPNVLICTAAGREGINLQFAHILFNYDLPWNPMDLEQRIGRIHRYGQDQTAQVFNLLAHDTIEGTIYLLLETKLKEIATALGKVDENGQVAEDLRAQILGQLGSSLSYDALYQEAVRDPSLTRTRQELEVALGNAKLAREVVFELFQDLEKFDLSDYKRYDDQGVGMERLVSFVQRVAPFEGAEFRHRIDQVFELAYPTQSNNLFTTDRDYALQTDDISLLGLEHPIVKLWLDKWNLLAPEERGIIVRSEDESTRGFLTVWQVLVDAEGGQVRQKIVYLGITPEGERSTKIERLARNLRRVISLPTNQQIDNKNVLPLINTNAAALLHRELTYSSILTEGASYTARLLGLIHLI